MARPETVVIVAEDVTLWSWIMPTMAAEDGRESGTAMYRRERIRVSCAWVIVIIGAVASLPPRVYNSAKPVHGLCLNFSLAGGTCIYSSIIV